MIRKLRHYSTMKDSGVEWLGEVPKQWEVSNLRKLLANSTKRNRPDLPLLSVVREKGVILRDVTNFTKNHNFIPDDLTNYKVVYKGQFAMNKMKAWQGSYGVSRQEGIVSPAYFIFDIKSVTEDYFHVAIRSRTYIPFFARASDGVRIGQWDLSQARMREIPFLVPTIAEQSAIVRNLNYISRRINRYIRAKQKLIKLLKEQKQVIIHQAVIGQINVRTGQPYQAYKDSGVEWLGQVPEHWETCKIKSLARMGYKTFVDGDWIESPYITSDGIRLIQTGNIGVGEYKEKGFRYISEQTFKNFGCTEINPDDILICRLGEPVARACLAPNLGKRMITSVDVCILKLCDDYSPQYFVYALSSYRYLDWVGSLVRGSTRNRVSRSMLGTFSVPFPPSPEQTAIVAYLNKSTTVIDTIIDQTIHLIDLLRKFRTRLIADVVTGKLDVREAAAALPEVDSLETEESLADALDEETEVSVDELDAIPEEIEA